MCIIRKCDKHDKYGWIKACLHYGSALRCLAREIETLSASLYLSPRNATRSRNENWPQEYTEPLCTALSLIQRLQLAFEPLRRWRWPSCKRSDSTRSSCCRRRCRFWGLWLECRVCWAGMSYQKDGSCRSHRSVTSYSWSCIPGDVPLGRCSPLCWSSSVLHVSSTPNLGWA